MPSARATSPDTARADHPDLPVSSWWSCSSWCGCCRAIPTSAILGDPRDRRGGRPDQSRSSASTGRSPSSSCIFLEQFLRGDLGNSIHPQGPGDPAHPRAPAGHPVPDRLRRPARRAAGACRWPSSPRCGATAARTAPSAPAFQIGLSMPVFYIGIVLLTFFAAQLRWFPVGGFGETLRRPALSPVPAGADPGPQPLGRADAQPAQQHHRGAGRRVCRLRPRQGPAQPRLVLARHVLRNALISTVTLFGLNIGTLLGGAVITETVFAIPGVGRLMIDSHLRPRLSGHPGPDPGARRSWSRWSSS